MNKINNLVYFLNSMKETLPFEDEDDFKTKINENKEFKIRIQKLVYLSKFFGWDNSYHFNFHERGPYSIELSNDYQKLNEFNLFNSPSIKLNVNSLKMFISNHGNDFLEATSTILYYLSKVRLESPDENDMIGILMYLKPHLSKEIIEKAYVKIKEYDLLNTQLIETNQDLSKEIVMDKLDGLTAIFENFEGCSNQILLLGSIDYFRIALKREQLKNPEKYELLESIYDYGEFLEKFYFTNYNMVDNFSYFDLTTIDKRFDKLQDYISDLKILPRLYDEDVDLNIFCE